MTNDYQAPDPEFAEMVFQTDAESTEQVERLEGASADELKIVARDRSESDIARGTALMGLMRLRDPEVNDLILELFDDLNQNLWRMAIVGARCDDSRIRTRLLSLLDDSDDQNWSEAAVWLARTGEMRLLPRFVEWLERGDEGHRNVAIECLKLLKSPVAQSVLKDYWTSGRGDDEIRLSVAGALLELGDECGKSLLESVAQRAEGSWSVFAATAIYIVQASDGLSLMLKILDDGDLEARQSMVNQIWNFARLPHAFTADGLSEARIWVQSQLESPTHAELYGR